MSNDGEIEHFNLICQNTSNFSDLGVGHLHVELGLLADVDWIGEAGFLEVTHG